MGGQTEGVTPIRIVSLVPSVTETLSSWGVEPIACTRFCERADLEHVGGTKDPDVGRVVALAPDLVVVDEEENRREDFDALVASGLNVHVLGVRDLADVSPSMAALSDLVGGSWAPFAIGDATRERARVFVPIWRRPWMALGAPTYGSSLLSHLGFANVLEDSGPYPAVDLDDVIARAPDYVLAPSEPYPFTSRQRDELERVAPTVFVDGRDLFWWGARSVAALGRLGQQLEARLSADTRLA